MKAALQLKLGQQLTLTPQLRQAIRLLQLSTVELEAEITAALETNPLLERPEEAEPGEPAIDESAAGATDGRETEAAGTEGGEEASLDFEPGWEEDYPSAPAGGNEDFGDTLADSATEDLQDHLLWQLNLTPLSPRDRSIGVALIEAIGDDGYLREPLEAIQAGLRPEIECGQDEIEAVLHRIQNFDPIGVGARSLKECLAVQLFALSPDTPALTLAQRICNEALETLAKNGPERLAREFGVGTASMQEAVNLLRSLDPRPGAQIAPLTTDYVAPDAYTFRQGGIWRVSLAPGSRPRLAINRHYESLIARSGRSDATYLRGQLQEARWLIKSLETRADTLLRVAQAIVRQQSGFLEHGPEAMRPLTLREIADELVVHESTVSRITTRKYLHTPRGTFEFKHFFASGLATVDGGSASSTAIQAMLKRLIEKENPHKPLSDARLVAELKAAGITVARRTVAKYREAMHIPSSNERQRLQ